ncbi:MAG: extracellular solute-binding protein, partial [Clostridia bacterium]|nr:extracellular solute-binding protein [Clostridia bacterium]
TGKAYANLAWSGDALWAMEDGENLDYFVPEVGGNIWFDGWAIPKTSQNKDAAYMFINFLCQPEIAIRNSMEIGYTNALSVDILQADADVIAILEENEYDAGEYFSDELRYPVIDAKLGVMKDFGGMNDDVVSMWERVKAEGSKTWILIVVIVAIVVAAAGVVAFFLLKNKKGRRMVRRAPVRQQQEETQDAPKDEKLEEDAEAVQKDDKQE